MRCRLLSLMSLFCGLAQAGLGQASYVGTVGGAPIKLALNSSETGRLAGVYLYTKVGTPIGLSGRLQGGRLVLTEQDAHGRPTASLTIAGFAAARRLTGTWRNLATGQTLPLALTETPGQRTLLQAEALPGAYFETVLSQDAGPARVVAVRLLAKKTNRLVQQFAVDCQPQGLFSVAVGDFNFDNRPDFSVFESSYAGPNTSSLYFLHDPAQQRYVPSGFAGTSLEFDAQKRRVYEHNSCCAGSSVVTVEYKVVRSKLVELARHCYRWDDKKQELVERPASACQ